jgi:hypothetical protein
MGAKYIVSNCSDRWLYSNANPRGDYNCSGNSSNNDSLERRKKYKAIGTIELLLSAEKCFQRR